jgi:hypothetical protein
MDEMDAWKSQMPDQGHKFRADFDAGTFVLQEIYQQPNTLYN